MYSSLYDDDFGDHFETELRLNKANFFGSGSDLIVHVESASDLPDVHWLVGLSPKVVVFFPELQALNKSKQAVTHEKAFETKKGSGKNPVWDEKKKLRWNGENEICIKVFEERLLRKDVCLGQQTITLDHEVVKGVESPEPQPPVSSDYGSKVTRVFSTPLMVRCVSRISSEVELAEDEYELYSGPRSSGRPRIKVTFEVPADAVCVWCQKAMCECFHPPCLGRTLPLDDWVGREEYLKHPNVGQPVELLHEEPPTRLPLPSLSFNRSETLHNTGPLVKHDDELTSQHTVRLMMSSSRLSRVSFIKKRMVKTDRVEELAKTLAQHVVPDERTASDQLPCMTGIISQGGSSPQILRDSDEHYEDETKPQDLVSLEWKSIRTRNGWRCVKGRWRPSSIFLEGPQGGIESLKAELSFARQLAETGLQDKRSACEALRGAYRACLADFEPLDCDEIYDMADLVSELPEKDVARMFAYIEEAMKAALPVVQEMKGLLVAWAETTETTETNEAEPNNQLDNDEELALSPHQRLLDPSWTYWNSDHKDTGRAAYKDPSTGHVWMKTFIGFVHESERKADLDDLPFHSHRTLPSRNEFSIVDAAPTRILLEGDSLERDRLDFDFNFFATVQCKIHDDVQKVKAACEASSAGWNSEMEAMCGKACTCVLKTERNNLRVCTDKPESCKYWWAFPVDVLEPPDAAEVNLPRPGKPPAQSGASSEALPYWEPLEAPSPMLVSPAATAGTVDRKGAAPPMLVSPAATAGTVDRKGAAPPPMLVGAAATAGTVDRKGAAPPPMLVGAAATAGNVAPPHRPRAIARGSGKAPVPLLVNPKSFIPSPSRAVGGSHASSLEVTKSIAQAFRQFDANGDGVIDREELERLGEMLGIGVAELDELLAAADLTGDSTVDYEEFVSWICDSGDQFAEPFAHLRVAAALAYVADTGEELYVPMSRLQARLLLRPDGSFSYVAKNMARFSDGVQGIYEREGMTVSLNPEYFGSSIDPFDHKSYQVILTREALNHRGPRYAGCHVMHLPEAAVFQASWLAPT